MRMTPKAALTAILFSLAALPGAALAAGDAAAGKVKAYTCTGCHGIPGYKNTYPTYNVPKLAGQNAAYIVSALKAYQDGARDHGTMNLHAESLSTQDMEDIGAWFEASAPELVEAKEVKGAGEEKSAPCQACHGKDGKAVDANLYPNLGGQYASYLEHALRGYRDGDRNNALMMPFASNLTDEDIKDLAAWYEAQGGLDTIKP